MARFSDAAKIATQFGTKDAGKAIKGSTEEVVLNWVNNISIEMQKILMKTSTSRRNRLAQSLFPQVLQGSKPQSIKVGIVTTENYYDYVDKGVQKSPKGRGGSENQSKNKAPRSPYKFKNVGASEAMIESIKSWTADANASADDAERIAYFVKRKGLTPKNYIKGSITKQSKAQLSEDLSSTLGRVIKVQLVNFNK